VAQLPQTPVNVDDVEAPTQKRPVPAQLLATERQKSGLRTAMSNEEIQRFERREKETLPAPPIASDEIDFATDEN